MSLRGPATGDDPQARETLKSQVTQELGSALVAGRWQPGENIQLEHLAAHYGVSLSVVREAVSVLSSIGLVESRRRLGTIVQPASNWDNLNPQLINWRLADPRQRADQFHWLIELRAALEPAAASLAALRRSPEQAARLVDLAQDLQRCAGRRDLAEFLNFDIEFHQELYLASGNPQIGQMANQMQAILTARHQFGLMPSKPDPRAIELHALLARAIMSFDVESATFASTHIVTRATAEFEAAMRASRSSTES